MESTRRELLFGIGCSFLSRAAMITGAERLFMVNAIAGPSALASDYKALVCVFMFGGNDANNTLIPLDGYSDYDAVRGGTGIAIPASALLPISPPSAGARFGLHPSLNRLQGLWQQQKVAIVTNVGTLVEPLTREQYLLRTGPRPYQLFSHSDQQNEWQTSYADSPFPTGWGGRAADLTQDDSTGFPTVASVAGVTIFSAGRRTRPLVLAPAPTPLNQTLRIKRAGDAVENSAFQTLLSLDTRDSSSTLVRDTAKVSSQAIANSLKLSTDPSLITIFPNTGLGNQLKQISKLIKVSSDIGLKRQIFFCSVGGFDTHNNQGGMTGNQANLLNTVSDAMGAFYDATVELGVSSQVTTFTVSDFSRTFKPGGSGAGTGTDHAWGSHQFVMGDSVCGGDFYGTYPALALNGPNDTDTGSGAKGRWIPTTAVDQYAATLGAWFGVSPGDLPTVFPNIGRFQTPDLGFLSACSSSATRKKGKLG